jgi:hypothetical protein
VTVCIVEKIGVPTDETGVTHGQAKAYCQTTCAAIIIINIIMVGAQVYGSGADEPKYPP